MVTQKDTKESRSAVEQANANWVSFVKATQIAGGAIFVILALMAAFLAQTLLRALSRYSLPVWGFGQGCSRSNFKEYNRYE